MIGRTRESNLHRELRVIDALQDWARGELYQARPGGWRADATTAIAASAAEETYWLTDHLRAWQNETSALWRTALLR
jgi:hypothetical protein